MLICKHHLMFKNEGTSSFINILVKFFCGVVFISIHCFQEMDSHLEHREMFLLVFEVKN